MKTFQFTKKRVSRFYFAATCVLLTLLCLGFFLFGIKRSRRTIALFCVLILSILVLYFCIRHVVGNVFDRLSFQKKQELSEQRMRNAVRLSKQNWQHDEKIFRIHHDIKNHLGMVRSMLLDGNEEQAEEYIEKLRISLRKREFKND